MHSLQEQPYCRRYCCSAFHQFQDSELTEPTGLTNRILPLFAPERYKSNIDYTILEPCLRLATRLLTSGGAASWLVTMVDGDIYVADGDSGEQLVSWEEVDSMRDLRGNAVFPKLSRHPIASDFEDVYLVKRRALQILRKFSQMIDIDFVNLPSDVRGYSKALEGPLTPNLMTHWPRGVRSEIFVASDMYFEMLKLTTPQKEGTLSSKELERLLLTQFQYAKTLVHEVGHALIAAVQGSIHRGEPFLADCEIAEGGYSLEAAIFGGLLDGNITMTTRQYAKEAVLCRKATNRLGNGQYVKNALTLTQWPSGVYQHSYYAGHAIMGSRKELNPIDEVARIPLSFISDLFSDRFWTTHSTRYTLEALPVPTKGSWLVGVDVMTERQFVCDIGDPSLDPTIRSCLSAIIDTEVDIGIRAKRPKSADKISSHDAKELGAIVRHLTVKPKRQEILRSRRLVAIFGDEIRQAVEVEHQKDVVLVSRRGLPAKPKTEFGGLSHWRSAWYRLKKH